MSVGGEAGMEIVLFSLLQSASSVRGSRVKVSLHYAALVAKLSIFVRGVSGTLETYIFELSLGADGNVFILFVFVKTTT